MKDKKLFTPGPLSTSRTVKEAMLRDVGSRDAAFIETVRDIRRRLLRLAGVEADTYTAVLMQGSGTFALESVVGSVLPRDGRLLVLVNGAYGERIVRIAAVLGIEHEVMRFPEPRTPDPAEVDARLAEDATITHVASVHCETTSGILNPIEPIGAVVKKHERCSIVDAMSSFGAVPIDFEAAGIDFLVSSANKCIEGVPGFAFVIAQRDRLLETKSRARSLSLDLYSQWHGLESNGQFRFTPPTHALLAFHQALVELDQEGGVAGRAARYRENHEVLLAGMEEMGFFRLSRARAAEPHHHFVSLSTGFPIRLRRFLPVAQRPGPRHLPRKAHRRGLFSHRHHRPHRHGRRPSIGPGRSGLRRREGDASVMWRTRGAPLHTCALIMLNAISALILFEFASGCHSQSGSAPLMR